jgi:hypothetical protein
VSRPGGHRRLPIAIGSISGNIASLLTHLPKALGTSLDHPLFCKQKRGFKNILCSASPLCLAADTPPPQHKAIAPPLKRGVSFLWSAIGCITFVSNRPAFYSPKPST